METVESTADHQGQYSSSGCEATPGPISCTATATSGPSCCMAVTPGQSLVCTSGASSSDDDQSSSLDDHSSLSLSGELSSDVAAGP